jgi:hypothetical protein
VKYTKTQDHYLHPINKFKDDTADKLFVIIRKLYINLDTELRGLVELEEHINPEVMRTLALARTNLETSLMYAIKTICILECADGSND